ncbi:DoxX family protein [Streptomyces bambusae]|uniref:DoxX family protein n=1 Tax=Streptomyces bambusae TaxID=1550616 RepID=UPI001CFE449E|nr:DoxX family protein [Streptomyces bambusae]MCB5166170.1 DoxX family protein [Streptomyces bambusae]
MSVDTRTPRFDDQPALSMVKVPCDPAQVIVNHASFRVQLAAAPRRPVPPAGPLRVPALSGAAAVAGASVRSRRRAPVVWSGKSDGAATGGLLQAVREAGHGHPYADDGGTTQVIPRIDLTDDTMPTPTVVGQRTRRHDDDTQLIAPLRDHDPRHTGYGGPGPDELGAAGAADDAGLRRPGDRDRDTDRQGYYPGRRMNLGVVLLPLRVFLGFISIYAGMGKLCDPVYFDGGERGSMVTWLHTLHPWALAEPLRDFALSHPVGSGLTVAFLQVIVGVLTVFGLWQRFAGCIGALLSAALLMTVSWKTVPAYDAPDIIYLAAWSPLIIAGAPVYSIDARLSGEAWRTLGPRSALWELRRRVLRRGAMIATVVVGLTLLIGSVLGGAVRSTTVVTVPGPGDAPSNYLPGQPLPHEPAKTRKPVKKAVRPTTPASTAAEEPTARRETTPGTSRPSGTRGAESPTATRGTGTGGSSTTPRQTTPKPPPATTGGPTSTGGTTGGGSTGGTGEPGGREPGLVGGLLG